MGAQPMTSHHVIIADDHPLFRDALKQTLDTALPGAAITEVGSVEKLLEALSESANVDLVLLDLKMPGEKGAASLSGLTGLMYLRSQHPVIPVVVVSASDNPSMVRRCLNLGASGFISKSLPIEQIRSAVKTVLDGGVWFPSEIQRDATGDALSELAARLATLTPQQVRVLSMLGQGLLNKQIAFELSVSEATVKAHVSAILQKLGVDSRTQAVIAVNRISALDGHGDDTGELTG
jgi:DNA-binding NarL/FixJ family response regulator